MAVSFGVSPGGILFNYGCMEGCEAKKFIVLPAAVLFSSRI